MGAYGLPDTQNGASGVPLARRSLPRCASDLARGSVLQLITCRGRFSPAGTTEDGGVPISLGECIDGEAALSVKSAASPSVSFQRICRPMLSAIVRIIQEPVCKTNGPRGSILPPGSAVWIRLLYILASCASICMLSGVSPSRRARAYTSSRPLVSK